MKKSEFQNIIREIVCEELKKQLPKILSEIFSGIGKENVSSTSNDSEEVISQPSISKDKTSLKEMLDEDFNHIPQSNSSNPPKKVYTSDSVLNEILNQTRPFNRSERGEIPSVGSNLDMSSGPSPYQNDTISVLDVKENTPAPVQAALSRNYSKFMKLVDKKKQKGI